MNNKTNNTELSINYLFLAVAALATFYSLWMIFPLFKAFYYWDDLGLLNVFLSNKGNPLGLLVSFDVSWWKPLSCLLAGLFMQLGGLNAFPLHIAGFIVHLAIGLALWHLAR